MRNKLDEMMVQGDRLDFANRALKSLPLFISVNQLPTRAVLYEKEVEIQYEPESPIYAKFSLDNLVCALMDLFARYQHGIVIYGVVARALSKSSDRFYLFDSHSINAQGLPATDLHGTAAVFIADSVVKLAIKLFDLISHTSTTDLQGSSDPRNQFTIDPIKFSYDCC